MDIKYIIETFRKAHESIEETIENIKPLYSDEQQLWPQLEKLSVPVLIHEKLINFLADSMQMVNDEERFKSFDLEDIKTIYQLLVEYYPNNIQYRLDLIGFVYNVLDNEKEASALANEAVKMMDTKRTEFVRFLK
ncbi:hypothetical protein [Mucilaginibacter auburnensis]|uniref:Uncharacterized protein n=1 Tax=Mucilaginibacter auburnensis TaxID=1457233 RepID=A0A2H9VPA4_9SPHI|nr:hypothetical protein [Mucilaginibacter auburnensis]PJJ80153.1 hypothetical protein CLV57_3299 [Mucilaginibacter auburnensis]